jgi:nuclear pore complex protein Nup85
MQTKEAWDHPSFWPYVARCILRGFHLPASSFLRTLTNHPHQPISKLAAILHHHLSVLPRSHQTSQYPLESQFVQAHRSWLGRLRAEVSTFLGGRPKGKWLEEGDWKKFEEGFRVVIDLMEGKADAVLDQAADWREALGAWGVLVDVQFKRDDLP